MAKHLHVASHQMVWRTNQLYIARMLSRSYALSSANGLQVITSLWNLMLPFTGTGQITPPWTRIHLEFCSICPLSYFFSSLSFPASLTLALFPKLLAIPTVLHPFWLSCFPSPFSPELQVHTQSAILPPFQNMSTYTTHLYAPKPTVIAGNQARFVLLLCKDVSPTPTHWHHHQDPSLPSSKASVNITKINPFHAWYQFGYSGPQSRLCNSPEERATL